MSSSQPSILDEETTRRSRPVTPNIMRPGIRVLTKAHQSNEKARALYLEGVKSGLKFKDIERKVKDGLGLEKSPLTPKNVPFFTCRAGDCQDNTVPGRLMELYGEVREEIGPSKRIYSFPIVPAYNDWLMCMPHGLEHHTASGIKHWSEYEEDGERYCKQHGQVVVDRKAKRGMRVYGGRPIIDNPDMKDGICSPNNCDIYQVGACNLEGHLIFTIPGSEAGLWNMGSGSYYSMAQWKKQLQLVLAVRGRLTGLHNGRPVLWADKVRRKISRIVDGESMMVSSLLVDLRVDGDLIAMAEAAQLMAPEEAAAQLEAPVSDDADNGGVDDESVDYVDVDVETGEMKTEPSAVFDDDIPF